MIPAALFQQVVTVQNRDLSDPDPMETSTTWVDVEELFCMVNMLPDRKDSVIEVGQPFALSPFFKFTFRGNKAFPLGEIRFLWNNEVYEPTSITLHPGIFRNEELTYVTAQKTSGLTAP